MALICPSASRTLVARKLKGLDETIQVTVVNPELTTEGWGFGGYPGADDDPQFGVTHINGIYTRGYYSIKALNPLGIRPTGPEHIDTLLASVR